jgi:vacuolar-type H+-ATPase catalytic subunit A/Vma1
MVLPACSSSTEDNTQTFCDSLAALARAEANVRSINANTTVEQADQYRQELKNAWNDAVNAKKNLTVSKYNDLEASYRELESSLNSLEGSQTVAQALPSIQAAMATFDANLNEIRTTVCSYTPTSSP